MGGDAVRLGRRVAGDGDGRRRPARRHRPAHRHHRHVRWDDDDAHTDGHRRPSPAGGRARGHQAVVARRLRHRLRRRAGPPRQRPHHLPPGRRHGRVGLPAIDLIPPSRGAACSIVKTDGTVLAVARGQTARSPTAAGREQSGRYGTEAITVDLASPVEVVDVFVVGCRRVHGRGLGRRLVVDDAGPLLDRRRHRHDALHALLVVVARRPPGHPFRPGDRSRRHRGRDRGLGVAGAARSRPRRRPSRPRPSPHRPSPGAAHRARPPTATTETEAPPRWPSPPCSPRSLGDGVALGHGQGPAPGLTGCSPPRRGMLAAWESSESSSGCSSPASCSATSAGWPSPGPTR